MEIYEKFLSEAQEKGMTTREISKIMDWHTRVVISNNLNHKDAESVFVAMMKKRLA